jgi:hypothetical protein
MKWRDVADEHPLEALYRARDLVWQAAWDARQSTITHADQASYEHAVSALLDAVDNLSTSCELPQRSPGISEAADGAREIDRLGPEDFDHHN